MPNAAYDLVCDALSRIVSRRAAENMVSDALRAAKLSPQNVRPAEMQALLKGVVFVRLQQIIPVAQAKGEIRQILNQLEGQFMAARAFSPEVEEGWNALRLEFARVSDQSSPRAQRLAKSIAALPQASDPVGVLNNLWVELDLLQLERSPNPPLDPEPLYQGDMLLQSGEFSALNFELDHLENPTEPSNQVPLGRPGAGQVSRMNQDLNLTVIDEPAPVISAPVVAQTFNPAISVAPLELDLTALETVTPVPQVPIQPLTAAVPVVRKPVQHIRLDTPDAQDALLTRFALEEGVTGVLLSKRNGDVIASRLSSGHAGHLAGVVAATTMLLSKRRHFQVFYTHLESVSAFIAPLEDTLLTVLADAGVNVGRVFTELESLKETA